MAPYWVAEMTAEIPWIVGLATVCECRPPSRLPAPAARPLVVPSLPAGLDPAQCSADCHTAFLKAALPVRHSADALIVYWGMGFIADAGKVGTA